ncbi:MAG: TIGR02301 family protein [Methylocystis sp.]|uniref:TIGR02301 family protein n=1 Tax=Methylocystis sp. TaxID=1911079 RepID=UPI003DA535CE
MRRGVILASACALLLASQASAQGIFDIFGPDRPERAEPARGEKAKKKPDAAAKAKRDAAKAKPDAGKPDAAKPGAPAGDAPPPPYEPQLVRLSELLGALAFLRDLCGEKDGDEWRGKMSALIEAEAPGGPRRDKYVAAFNRGFRGYELTYRRCTPNARDATARYLDETAKISREVSYRFGTP